MNPCLCLFLLLWTSAAAWAGSPSCEGKFTRLGAIHFQLISPEKSREIIEKSDLDFRIRRTRGDESSLWRIESVGVVRAPKESVYKKSLRYEDIADKGPFIDRLEVSKDRKTLSIQVKVPVVGKFSQKIKMNPDPAKHRFSVQFEEGPFSGLNGEVQVSSLEASRSVVRAVFEGDIPDEKTPALLPVNAIELLMRALLKNMKSQMESTAH